MTSKLVLRYCSSIACTLFLLATCLPVTFSAPDMSVASHRKVLSELERAGEMQDMQQMQELRRQQRRAFTRSRALLNRERVPFDPDELLDLNWREKLSLKFVEMAEMQRDLHITSRRLKGVYIANKLLLPEKIRTDGDLVILARHLVYGGDHVEIIAPGHDVSVFVVESEEKLQSLRTRQAERTSFPTVYIRTGAEDLPGTPSSGVKSRMTSTDRLPETRAILISHAT